MVQASLDLGTGFLLLATGLLGLIGQWHKIVQPTTRAYLFLASWGAYTQLVYSRSVPGMGEQLLGGSVGQWILLILLVGVILALTGTTWSAPKVPASASLARRWAYLQTEVSFGALHCFLVYYIVIAWWFLPVTAPARLVAPATIAPVGWLRMPLTLGLLASLWPPVWSLRRRWVGPKYWAWIGVVYLAAAGLGWAAAFAPNPWVADAAPAIAAIFAIVGARMGWLWPGHEDAPRTEAAPKSLLSAGITWNTMVAVVVAVFLAVAVAVVEGKHILSLFSTNSYEPGTVALEIAGGLVLLALLAKNTIQEKVKAILRQ